MAVLLLAGGLVGCGDLFENRSIRPEDNVYTADETSVEEVADETEELIGQTVTITGEVEEIVGLDSFVLEDEESLFDGDQVLVISVNDTTEPVIREGETVQVTGEVRQFVWTELERDYDLTWDLDLRRELEAEYKDKPVVVADFTRVQ
ncbi:MAG: hypothetical protein SWJ54_07035 [Cyanobacteriota bacterium]|nr:hypothetical protein [Cyanobacteriota bacterium]